MKFCSIFNLFFQFFSFYSSFFSFSCNSRKWMIEWDNHCFERNSLRKVVNKFSKIEQKKFSVRNCSIFNLFFQFIFYTLFFNLYDSFLASYSDFILDTKKISFNKIEKSCILLSSPSFELIEREEEIFFLIEKLFRETISGNLMLL